MISSAMRTTLLLFLLLLCRTTSAQMRIGYYSEDTVLRSMNDHQIIEDSIRRYSNALGGQMNDMRAEYSRNAGIIGRDSVKWSPLIIAIRKKQQQDLKDRIDTFAADSAKSVIEVKEKLNAAYLEKISKATAVVQQKQRLDTVMNEEKRDKFIANQAQKNELICVTQQMILELKK